MGAVEEMNLEARTVATSIKARTRNIMASIYYRTGSFKKRLSGKVLILMYHRVLSEEELSQQYVQPGMYVKDNVFEMQMDFLKNNFQVLSLGELIDGWRNKTLSPHRRYCVVTFDDGWHDNYTHAYPILKKHKIPATIFLPTSFIGTNEWFWPDKLSFALKCCWNTDLTPEKNEALLSLLGKYIKVESLQGNVCEIMDSIIEKCKYLIDNEIENLIQQINELTKTPLPLNRRFLNWEEINEMSLNGVSFAPHSCTHRILTKLSLDDVEKEVNESRKILQEKELTYVPVFCYPNGDFTTEIADKVKNAGYTAAVSTKFGAESVNTDHYLALKRIGIHNDITETKSLFAYRISGSDIFKAMKSWCSH